MSEYAAADLRLHQLTLRRNKSRFNRLADGFGAALGKHAEWRKPSLAKTIPASSSQGSELGTRESMLTPAQQDQRRQRSASAASQASVKSTTSSGYGTPETRSLADVEARYREESAMVRQAQEAVMSRPNFAIDAIGDSDGEEDEEEGEGRGADDAVLDEVSVATLSNPKIRAPTDW